MNERREKVESPRILSGWKEVASYMGKGVRTAQRYERLMGLPVRRPAGRLSGSVIAVPAELDGWVKASPVREGFPLRSAESPVASQELKHGMTELKRLRDQMHTLRAELHTTLQKLQTSVQQLQGQVGALEPPSSPSHSLFSLQRVWSIPDSKEVSNPLPSYRKVS